MTRRYVRDKYVHSIAYDNRTYVLEVESTMGAVYQFLNVPPSAVGELTARPERTAGILERIAGIYQSVKVKDEPPEVSSWITGRVAASAV